MARAMPWYATELFGLLRTLGVPQKRCAAALSLPRQVITNWASGGVSVPARHRAALIAFVEGAIMEATATPDQYAQLCEQMHHALRRWADENLQRRAVCDDWYAAISGELARMRRVPLSTLTPAELQAIHVLHLRATQRIREALQRCTSPYPQPALLPLDANRMPAEVLWIIAEHVHGGTLTGAQAQTTSP